LIRAKPPEKLAMMANDMDKPNGPVSAALLAGGIGSAMIGILTLIHETNTNANFVNNMAGSNPVGAPPGESSYGSMAFFLAWAILYFVWKDKEINFTRISSIAVALLMIGLIGTYPPVWHLLGY
jgi:prolipoprotein diacylglyceryltransferase